MPLQKKRYALEMTAASALYTVVVVGVHFLPTTGNLLIAVALLPVLPAMLMIWVMLRGIAQMDELQQRIQFQALAAAAVGTGLLTFAYGFLEGAGFPRLSMIWVLPLLIAVHGISSFVVTRRYR